MNPEQRQRLRRLARIGGAVLALAAGAFVVVEVAKQWPQLVDIVEQAEWWWIVASFVVFALAELAYARTWPATLRGMGQQVPTGPASAIFLVTQTAKFIPGSVWAAVGRVGAGSRIGVPRRVVAASLSIEITASIAAALAIAGVTGTASALIHGSDDLAGWLRALEATAALALAALAFVLGRIIARRVARASGITTTGSRRAAALIFGRHVVVFLGWGLGAAALAQGLGASPGPVVGAFAASWVAGFVVIGAPAGLGVREAVMTALLRPSVGQATALAISLGSRAIWTIVQLAAAGIAMAALARRETPAPTA